MSGIRRLADVDWAAWQPRDEATLVFGLCDGRILLIRKKRGLGAGKINGPGGRLHAGESPAACAARELHEELLVRPGRLDASGELRFQFADGYSIHVHVFRTTGIDGDPTETSEAAPIWVPLDQIPYDEMWADDRLWLPLLIAGEAFDGWFLFDGDTMIDHRLVRRAAGPRP